MYHTQSNSGSSSEYWDENWALAQFEDSVRFMTIDPLRPLFEKYLKPNSLMLEGGCGIGNYAAYYRARGYRVVGVDFAKKALRTLHVRQPELMLCGGDVSRLPFSDKTFDLYYSGGVVEHFEGGAGPALDEAKRVLKDDGTLLISVPYYNPLRRLLTPFRKSEWRLVKCPEVDNGDGIESKKLFQYAYRTDEFESMLDAAGLRVLEKQGYAVIWGLSEISLQKGASPEATIGRVKTSRVKNLTRVDIQGLVKDQKISVIKRLAVAEDASVPILGLGVRLMRWAVANMMMYVCERR